MLKSCPDAIDVTDLQFKLQCRLKVFDNNDISVFLNTPSLISCASRYGLLFVGSNEKYFQVIQTKNLYHYSSKDNDIKDYLRRNVNIPSLPKHICCNCDSTILAVVVERDQCPLVIFYDILSFLTVNVKVIKELRLSATPNVHVREVNWNPSIPGIFTACKSDGTLGAYELKGDTININELPAASGTTCFCWSPKGKQIAVGNMDGKITQYKPDLKPVKIIPDPKLDVPHSLINLQWVSNYQFIGVYQQRPEGSSYVMVVDAPKTGDPSYTNYNDICYSGSSRPSQFYLIYQPNWNFVLIASANNTEVGVLSNNGDSWTQWIMPDSARAELPLSSDYQETLPIGLTLDISSTTPLPWGETTISPCPLLCILSHQGVLCCFNVIFLRPGIPSVCTPPDSILDQTGVSLFITASNQTGVNKVTHVKTQIETVTVKDPNVAISKPLSFNAPIQSTPLITNKTLSDNAGPFGDQPLITPIKATALFGGQTLITPVNKAMNLDSLATSEKTTASEKYSTIFSALNTSATSQATSASHVKSTLVTAPVNLQLEEKPTRNMTSQEFSKVITKPEADILDPELKAETAALLSQMIKDEWSILETELKILSKQCQLVQVNLGIDQEKIEMVEQIENLQIFLKEAVDISVGQSSEIHCLKQNVIQSWAWFEEARSHYNVSKNETVALLLRLQPLNSVAEKRLKDVQQLIYYIESQLSQASKTLDEQWENFQNHTKNKYKVKMPTMETIFQTMVRQSAILQKQTYVLKDISMRLRKKTSVSSSLLLSFDKANDLAEDLKYLHLSTRDVMELQCEKIRQYTKSLTMKKMNRLRNFLKQRPITYVTAVKTQLSTWNMTQLSASKIRQSLATLGGYTPPLSKASVVRNLDFTQSSPLKGVLCSKSTLEQTKSVDLYTQVLPFSLTTNQVPVTTGFISLSKSSSGILSNPGSAFAPTGSIPSVVATDQKNEIKSSLKTMPTLSPVLNTNSNIININSDANSSFIIKPTLSNAVSKSEPVSVEDPLVQSTSEFTFPFGQKNTVTALASSKPTNTNIFLSPASSGTFVFSTSSSQIDHAGKLSSPITSTTSTSTTPLNLVKPIQPPTTTTGTSLFGSQLFSFASTKGVANVTSATTAPLTSKSSGMASLFENTQASIAKTIASANNIIVATPFTTVATSSDSSKVVENTPSVFDLPSRLATTQVSKGNSDNIKLINTSETSTQSSIFNTNVKTSSFSALNFDQATSLTAVSNANKLSFGSTVTTGILTTPSTTIFGSTTIKTTTSVSPTLFGNATTTTSNSLFEKPITSSGSLFGNLKSSTTIASSTPPLFGNLATKTLASPTTSLFGNQATASTIPSSSTSLFGNLPTTTTFSTQSTFGNTQATPASTSLFGTPITTPVSSTPNLVKSPVFNANSEIKTDIPTTSTASSIFGNFTVSSTTTASIFGKNEVTVTTNSNNAAFNTPKSTSIFGSPAPNLTITTAASSNIFGQPISTSFPTTSTTSSNIFSSTSSNNIFGQSTTGASVFSAPTTSSSSASIFGRTNTPVSTANVFGTPSTTTSFGTQNNSIFGGTKISTPVFGQTTNFGNQPSFTTPQSQTTTSSSVFGQPSTFGSSSVFGNPTTTTSVTGFGNVSSTSSAFGSGFGSTSAPPSTSSGSFGFGSLNVASSAFGGSSSSFGQASGGNPFGKVEPKSTFGSTTTNIFGNTVSTSSSTFGSPTTSASSIFESNTGSTFGSSGGGFGSQNAFSSPFAQKPTFGQSTTFGSSSPFGNPQSPGSFSGGSSSVAQSGFASPTAFQKPSGFGNPPVFGAPQTPAFGAAPSFGSTPAFGTGPGFGSPDKVFGTAQSTASFGSISTQQQNAGFGNLASQNTIGFGNLAQQANTSNSMPFSGGSSFSTWR